MNIVEQNDKLNTLLSTVYDLADKMCDIKDNDLNNLIGDVVEQTEVLVDNNDLMLGDMK
mgnify:FL=1|tara:strand:+ start:129 stop:305 length:177 start_codon:yes stop_codon:yes gene_type:complete